MAVSVAAVAMAVGLAGCGSVDKPRLRTSQVDPKLGVSPSPRVVADGQPVPKGGGRSLLGSSYVIGGKRYTPRIDPSYKAVGLASWYGSDFHGRRTANGEVFDRYSISAAHPTMPLPSYARVTSLTSGRSIIVRVNDRGPYHSNRVLDMSQRAAEMLDIRRAGVAKIKVEYVGPAPLQGDDTRYLMASYRGPRDLPADDSSPNIMVAAAESIPGVSTLVRAIGGGSDAPARATPVRPAAAAAPMVVADNSLLDAPSAPPINVVPPARPVETFEYVSIASADPADILLGTQPVTVASVNTVAPPLSYSAPLPAPAAASPTVMFGNTVLPPLPPQVSGYAETRVSQAYDAFDNVDAGVGLTDLAHKLGSMKVAAPAKVSSAAITGPMIQVGVFGNPDNAARVAAGLAGYGTPVTDEVTINGKAMKRVRLTMLSVSPEAVIDAATGMGVAGARLLR
ncbi:septal ring lytic transglycosylase RlpA family protein [Oryzibacter oryziterrae]|uniref:septal ring lytic transglycosylase RlpA family protein n=1 Tax=Oryzibacter oryziterrae TaxID=2766474 RepID=UPI001F18F177|nr:septal ring lytic transglycosylase RlpA family protein [Oryzibacter oryziterrae]